MSDLRAAIAAYVGGLSVEKTAAAHGVAKSTLYRALMKEGVLRGCKRIPTTCAFCKKTIPPRDYVVETCSPRCAGWLHAERSRAATSVADLIRERVEVQHDGCWRWLGYCDPRGYGTLKLHGTMRLAHRLSYETFKGAIAKGLFICHRCDNPSCVNPDHLFAGTARENNQDRDDKGRTATGIRHHAAKLTPEIVENILASDEGHAALGRRYGVNRQTIRSIRKGRIWRNVSREKSRADYARAKRRAGEKMR